MRFVHPFLDNDEMGKDYDRDRIDKMSPDERAAASGFDAVLIALRRLEVEMGETLVWHPDRKIRVVTYPWDESRRQVLD